MAEPAFDHKRLDVYRLSIDYVAFSCQIAKSLGGTIRHIRDLWLRAAQSIPLNMAEGNGKQSFKDKHRFFAIARGSAFSLASRRRSPAATAWLPLDRAEDCTK